MYRLATANQGAGNAMTELLNHEQLQTLDGGGPVPIEGGAYVVLRTDVYEDMRRRLQEEEEAEAELLASARRGRKNAALRLQEDE